MRNGGWLHRSDVSLPVYRQPYRPAIPEKPIDCDQIWRSAIAGTTRERVDRLGVALGVDTDALTAIGCAWMPSQSAFAFPMRDAIGNIIGIRLRNERGDKWAVKGSKSGLFVPDDYQYIPDRVAYLVEGPTDLAAAMTIGLRAFGRAACLGQEDMILSYIAKQKIERLVILSDLDDPGIRGAEKLQARLPIYSVMALLPAKDVREFVKNGGRKQHMDCIIKDLLWTPPQVRAA